MGRKRKCRRIFSRPEITVFKPAGVPISSITGVGLGLDSLEAMRLVDALGLSQAEAAEQMRVSRPTLCRILAEGRKQVARALNNGMAIRIIAEAESFIVTPNQDNSPETQEATP